MQVPTQRHSNPALELLTAQPETQRAPGRLQKFFLKEDCSTCGCFSDPGPHLVPQFTSSRVRSREGFGAGVGEGPCDGCKLPVLYGSKETCLTESEIHVFKPALPATAPNMCLCPFILNQKHTVGLEFSELADFWGYLWGRTGKLHSYTCSNSSSLLFISPGREAGPANSNDQRCPSLLSFKAPKPSAQPFSQRVLPLQQNSGLCTQCTQGDTV